MMRLEKVKRIFFLASTLFFIILFCIGYSFYSFINSPINIVEKEIIFEITPGSSAKKLAYNLKEKNIIHNPKMFYIFTKITGLDTSIQSGEYLLYKNMTPKIMLDNFVDGKVVLYPFKIVEGSNIYQLINSINESPKIKKTIEDLNIINLSNSLGSDKKNLEGLFYPDTYFYSASTKEIDLLYKIHKKQLVFLEKAWTTRNKTFGLKDPYQALILASIVEKETSIKEEMPVVAGVYLNRLNKNMRLQADPTVIYGLGPDFNGKLSRKDLRKDTPYNTYTRGKLPPTPICMPSKEAILAVLNPKETEYLYFVANGEGGHTFSKNLKEHNKAVVLLRLRTQNTDS